MKNVLNYTEPKNFCIESRKEANLTKIESFGFSKIKTRNYSYDPKKPIQTIAKYTVYLENYEITFADCLDISLPNEALIVKKIECLNSGRSYSVNISINDSNLCNGRLLHLKSILNIGVETYLERISNTIEHFEEIALSEGFLSQGTITPSIQGGDGHITFHSEVGRFYLSLVENEFGQQRFAIANTNYWQNEKTTSFYSHGKDFSLDTPLSEILEFAINIASEDKKVEVDYNLIETGYNWFLNLKQ